MADEAPLSKWDNAADEGERERLVRIEFANGDKQFYEGERDTERKVRAEQPARLQYA